MLFVIGVKVVIKLILFIKFGVGGIIFIIVVIVKLGLLMLVGNKLGMYVLCSEVRIVVFWNKFSYRVMCVIRIIIIYYGNV